MLIMTIELWHDENLRELKQGVKRAVFLALASTKRLEYSYVVGLNDIHNAIDKALMCPVKFHAK